MLSKLVNKKKGEWNRKFKGNYQEVAIISLALILKLIKMIDEELGREAGEKEGWK